MIQSLISLIVLGVAVATYMYLDWGILQILGAGLVVLVVYDLDEQGPVWRKAFTAFLAFAFMVAAHFVVTDSVIYSAELVGAGLLLLASIGFVFGMLKHKPGDGSTLTVFFLGLIICAPLGFFFLHQGLAGLGYL